MRILILGAGGIGGYFGGRLTSVGVDVSFLVRPPRAAQLARSGLVVTSSFGDLRVPVEVLTEAQPGFDAVLLACKAYDLDGAMDAVAPAIGASTIVVPLLNGVRHLDVLDARFGRERVLGGLCFIGVTMSADGEIQHLNSLHRFVLGARTPAQTAAASALHVVVERGGFNPELSDVIMQEMWEKFAFITVYAGMTTLMQAPVGAILATGEGEAIMQEMLAECVATAAASGYAPRAAAMAQMTSTLAKRGSRGAASMLRDMERNGPTEHEHIIGDMLARAQAAGVSAPLLRVALARMQAYEAMRSQSFTR